MISDGVKKYCYFTVENLLEFYSSKWLKNKKAATNNDDNFFQNALTDALDY